jgi:hypothetical protein
MSSAVFATADNTAVVLPAEACLALCHELPRAANLDAAMDVVENVRRSLMGYGLLTVNLDVTPADARENAVRENIDLQRLWTSNPVAYPAAGRKRKTMTPWTQNLMLRAEVFVGEGDDVLTSVFEDHALISSLGLHAVINVPLLDETGRCFATFNVLGPQPKWRSQDVLLVRLLAALAAPAVHRAAVALDFGDELFSRS